MSTWTTQDIPDQTGRHAIVTGGNSGIGFETAKALTRAGARVIVAARDADKGQEAIQRINAAVPTAQVEAAALDLASLASITAFAEQLRERGQPIDLLINNAGVMAIPERRLTRDGFEVHMGTNHLGHFALTGQLLPLLLQSSAPRVVTVSAVIARWDSTRLDIADLQSERNYTPMGAYARSKLANLLFMVELDRRARHLSLTSVAVHPGTSFTNLQRHSGPSWLGPLVRPLFNRVLGQSAAQSALPSLYAATATGVSGSAFVGPTGFRELRGAPGLVALPPRALDEQVARALWEMSEQLTHVHFTFPTTRTSAAS